MRWMFILMFTAEAFAIKYCDELDNKYKNDTDWPHSEIFFYGQLNNLIVLHARSSPARAAAALLVAAMRHGPPLRYRDVTMAPGPADLCEYNQAYNQTTQNFTELIIDVSVKWSPEKYCPVLCNDNLLANTTAMCWLGGARLQAVPRAGATLQRIRGLLYIPPWLRNDSLCVTADTINFFRNATEIQYCNFNTTKGDEYNATDYRSELLWNDQCNNTTCVLVFIPSDWTELAESWAKMFNALNIPLLLHPLESDEHPRRLLIDKFRNSNQSFLFIDHEEWMVEGVRPFLIEQPQNHDGFADENTFSLRLADVTRLKMTAPRVYETLRNFTVYSEDIRDVLAGEARHDCVMEAACEWATQNPDRFEGWMPRENLKKYFIYVTLCKDDPDFEIYLNMLATIKNYIRTVTKWAHFEYKIVNIKCSDKQAMTKELLKPIMTLPVMRVAGVVAAGAGVPSFIENHGQKQNIPILTYDAPSYCDPTPASNTGEVSCLVIPSIVGHIDDLAFAFGHLFSKYQWRRIAILSEKTSFASVFSKALLKATDSIVHIEREITKDTIVSTIKEMKSLDARVFVLNTGVRLAGIVVCEAVRAGLGNKEYAWVAREWRPPTTGCASPAVLLSVSPAWRGSGDSRNRSHLQAALAEKSISAPLLAPLTDALLTFAAATDQILENNSDQRDNLRSANWMKLLSEKVMNWNVEGVVQPLRSSNKSIRHFVRIRSLVFIDEWHASKPSTLATWCVENGTLCSNFTELLVNPYALTDGTKKCITTSTGDPFSPVCHSGAWFGGATATIVALVALVLVRRWRLRLLRRHDNELKVRLVRCELALRATRARLVSRDRLELLEELGAGYFGRVRLAVLREPGLPPMELAAKELAKDAPAGCEQEFLREASLVARLDHTHVVRLAGVCVDGEVPLLLMERAFFGDMGGYLRARRHLAARHGGEAEQVSAGALTRLGREAAAALEYLAATRVVHRDLRAANCLIDERRVLVVADFGMARQLGEDSDDQYECTRRALFPVRWMAPESLESGVFSYASDAWALGVLLLELVTLGERPYGGWSLQAVVAYVREGGHPPLPPDVSPLTRYLVDSCWRRVPQRRATAAAVQAFLEANPRALVPVVPSSAVPAPPTEASSPSSDLALADSGYSDISLNRFT